MTPDFSRLEDADARLIDLAYIASATIHRAVNHLGAIVHGAEFLQGFAKRSAPEIQPDADKVLDTALDTASLLRDLAGVGLAMVSKDVVALELNEFARRVAEEMAALAGPSASWTLALDEPCPMRGDPRHLKRMLQHLLARAAQLSSGAGGEVTLATRAQTQGKPTLVIGTRGGPWPPDDELAALATLDSRDIVIARAIWRNHSGRFLVRSSQELSEIHLTPPADPTSGS